MSDNMDITARLEQVEQSLVSNAREDSVRSLNLHDLDQFAQSKKADRQSALAARWSIVKFSFEGDLEQCRAYQKATRDTMDFSSRSSVVGSHAWSTLSDLSLSDISLIAVVALPIFSCDITNSQHYRFGHIESKPVLYSVDTGEFPRWSSVLEYINTQEDVATASRESSAATRRVGSRDDTNMSLARGGHRSSSISGFLQEYSLVVVGGGGTNKSSLVMQVSTAEIITWTV